MNERIQELALQAGFTMISDGCYDKVSVASVQEFVELLIRECTNMLPDDSIRNADGVHMFYVIREHFGVKD